MLKGSLFLIVKRGNSALYLIIWNHELIVSDYIDVDATKFLEVYSYFFEIGNIITPYVLLCFFPDLRKEFFRRIKPQCHSSEHDLHD